MTGGTDGIRVARTGITLLGGLIDFKGSGSYQKFVYAYYYYVLALFAISAALMWVIVHSPFGKALQAIRDNEIRAGFVGIRVRRYRWIAFVISGCFERVLPACCGCRSTASPRPKSSIGRSRARSSS